MINVLAFPCGSEIALEVYRSLSKVKDVNLFGASSVEDHGRFVFSNYIGNVPYITDDDFIEFIKQIVDENNIHAIFPCLDIAIPLLKRHEKYLNCKVISSPVETAEICLSKRKTYGILSDFIRVPEEYSKGSVKQFPVFLKPEVGSSSRFTFTANSKDELDFYISKYPNHMILENLPGNEYTIDCFTDFKGVLKFIGARERSRIVNGISVKSIIVKDNLINEIAHKINTRLKMDGAWFFQLKKDKNGEYCLLEVASRFGGSSVIQRYLGVNFSHLSLLNAFNENTEITLNNFEIEIDRSLDIKFKTDISFDTVYIDYDDTLVIKNQVNIDVVKAIYHFINLGKRIILLTKHRGDLQSSLSGYKLNQLFDKIIHISTDMEKSDYIKPNSIFIDDSYSERKKVVQRNGIHVFEPCNINCLL
jgi:hypothetical protein